MIPGAEKGQEDIVFQPGTDARAVVAHGQQASRTLRLLDGRVLVDALAG